MGFEVIPSIDIRGGNQVRLYQGDFDRESVFSEDPVAVARQWDAAGATRLHVVDLDGAATGEPAHAAIISDIVAAISMPVQLGGGIRGLEGIYRYLSMGVQRVVLGTAAVEEPDLLQQACDRFEDSIVVSIDARDGLVATHGWKQSQQITALELLTRVEAAGVQRVIYTDIAQDGAMAGPNFQSIGTLLSQSKAKVIAAGGVSSIHCLQQLAEMGLEGAIIGRALYTGDIDLAEAITATQAPGT